MIILGIGGILGDAACALLKDGRFAAAVEEKKIARRHQTATRYLTQAMAACLKIAGVSAGPGGLRRHRPPVSGGSGVTVHLQLRSRFPNSRFVLVEHHAAHAASAYYPSGFDEATVLTLDRSGDFRCGSRWQGAGNDLHLEKELYVPDSLGDLYGRVTELLGFQSGADEHKVQWLSAAGDDRFVGLFEEILGNGLAARRSLLVRRRPAQHGRVEQPLLPGASDSANNSPSPQTCARHVAAGIQRAVERTVSRMAGERPGSVSPADSD